MYNGTPFTVEKISPRVGLEPGTARSVGVAFNPLSYRSSANLVNNQPMGTSFDILRAFASSILRAVALIVDLMKIKKSLK